MKFAKKYFFHQYALDTALKASLSEEAGLGAHGNVTVISRESTGQWIRREYIWSHVASHSWGNDVSQQCGKCKRLCPWTKPKVAKKRKLVDGSSMTVHLVEHTCSFCGEGREFIKPDDLICDSAMGESSRGDWYFIRSVLSHEKS